MCSFEASTSLCLTFSKQKLLLVRPYPKGVARRARDTPNNFHGGWPPGSRPWERWTPAAASIVVLHVYTCEGPRSWGWPVAGGRWPRTRHTSPCFTGHSSACRKLPLSTTTTWWSERSRPLGSEPPGRAGAAPQLLTLK